MIDADEQVRKDINTVIDAIVQTSTVLANDAKHELEPHDREHLIDVIDRLSTMLSRWYHIR